MECPDCNNQDRADLIVLPSETLLEFLNDKRKIRCDKCGLLFDGYDYFEEIDNHPSVRDWELR